MEREVRRRAAIVALLALVALAFLLAVAPGQLASIHLGGVSLLWWYAGLVAPLAAVGIAAAALLTRAP